MVQVHTWRPISLSLPFNLHNEPLKGHRVSHYFEGLLPDSDTIRKRVAVRFKTGSTDALDLLAAIGRDCVGALQLLPEGVEPEGQGRVDGIVVDDGAIERHLLDVVNPGHYGDNAEPLIQDFIARTPAIVDKVCAELPAGFSEKVADRILGGILASAQALERMSPV